MTIHHDAIETLLAPYALDAVSPEESEAVEAYLVNRPRERMELDEYREVMAFLASEALEATAPPAAVWEGVAAQLEQAPPPLELVPAPKAGRWLRWTAAFSAVAAAVAVVLGVAVVRQSSQIDELQDEVAAAGLEQAAAQALADPAAEVVTLASGDGSVDAQLVVGSDGVGYLVGDSLPALSEDRTYQLWAIVGDQVISAGVFGPDPAIAPFQVDGDIAGFAITEEVAGGVVSSKNDPVVVWLRNA